MRLLFVSQYFAPERGATSELLTGIANELARGGFTVGALAGQPSYFGATRISERIETEGVVVNRVWSTQLDKNATLGRVLNSVTFSLSLLASLLLGERGALAVAVTNPPLLLWVCYLANRLAGRRYVLLIHDVYPDIAVTLGVVRRGSLIETLWRVLNRLALSRAERVVVLGRDMQKVIAAQMPPARSDRLVLIANWADGKSIVPIARDTHPVFDEFDIRDRFVVQYSGNIGRFHEIDTILEAASELASESRFTFLFYGEGKQVGQVRAAAASASRSVIHAPFQPREKLGLTLTGCDVGLVTLKEGLAGLAVPSKLYGILAAGKPVIVVGPSDCEAALLVTEMRCGAVVQPGDSIGLANLLRELREDPQRCKLYGDNARAAFERDFDLGRIAKAWTRLFNEIRAAT